jgi:phospho-N-acetylmuramoyl-pentapeptide-transferase
VLASTFVWSNLAASETWVAILGTTAFSLVGFADDYLKVRRGSHHGLRPLAKLSCLIIVAGLVGAAVWTSMEDMARASATVAFPFVAGEGGLHLGPLYVAFAVLVLVGASNAVNVTDGVDGLAGSIFVVSAGALIASSMWHGDIDGSSEPAVFGAALVGATLGFLRYNWHPAALFMGDTGALGLGGGLGIVAILTKQELLLPLAGAVFVAEGLSVVIQLTAIRCTGKRVLRMAPLHHHFELGGWSETRITRCFVAAAAAGALISFVAAQGR